MKYAKSAGLKHIQHLVLMCKSVFSAMKTRNGSMRKWNSLCYIMLRWCIMAYILPPARATTHKCSMSIQQNWKKNNTHTHTHEPEKWMARYGKRKCIALACESIKDSGSLLLFAFFFKLRTLLSAYDIPFKVMSIIHGLTAAGFFEH